MSEIANALVHLHDRLAELKAEVKPRGSPRTVVTWTAEDLAATEVLVDVMWKGVTPDHAALLRTFAERDRRQVN